MPAEILNALIAGSIGGIAGVVAGYPLDTVKVRLQTQNKASPQYNGILHCLRYIVSKEGPVALYKGMSSPLASVALVNALCFSSHGQVAKQFSDTHSISTQFISGAAAGACQAFVVSPMELIKIRLQIQNKLNAENSPTYIARQIIREKGVRYLTRGFLATQLRDCPAMGVYFASFELIGRQMSCTKHIEGLNSWQLLLAGGAAGMLSWLANYPTDIIKTRFQADESYSNYSEVIRRIYSEGGYRAFYTGLCSTLIRAFPSNAATFFAVEWTYRLWLRSPSSDSSLMSQSNERQILTTAAGLLIPSEAGSTLLEPILVI